MHRLIYLSMALFAIFWNIEGMSQGVSINSDNSSPAPSAMLDVKSTSQGILFPRMTTSQRDAISSPANGLHIFNTTSNSLEYYDSVFASWTPYCKDCGVFYDTITGLITNYTLPAEAADFYKIQILIISNAVVIGNPGNPEAINLQSANSGASIIIQNYGQIIGCGGNGGHGGGFTMSPECPADAAQNGYPGGDAIHSKPGTKLKIDNYGLIAGGGGGGGGGGAGSSAPDAGGGGGAGAGCGASYPNSGGFHGTNFSYQFVISSWLCVSNLNTTLGEDGQPGTLLAGGLGGNGGQSGSPLFAGYAGGNGGGLGQAGQDGVASFYNPGGLGGQPGKAISGNPGNNTVINYGSGSLIGVVE